MLGDAADAVGVAARAMKAAGGEFDLAVSCVNVPDAEMAAILATRDGGIIYFFSMSTSFTKAALGAEGVSRDVTMIVGNGYAPATPRPRSRSCAPSRRCATSSSSATARAIDSDGVGTDDREP